jgi:hypothetical protein
MNLQKVVAVALTALRAASLGLRLQGQVAAANALDLIAAGVESGKNVDAHMAEVAAKLKAGEPIDWVDVVARIEADSADLHSPPTG